MPKRFPSARTQLDAIMGGSDDAIIGKSLEGVITSWNEGARRIYGYAAKEVIGRPISLLAPHDRQEEIRTILKKVKRGETISHYETVRKRKDGKIVYVSLTVSPIRDRAGKVIGASTIARDITERKISEERFRLVVEATPSAIVMVNREGKIVLVNSQTERLFGYTRDELIGRPVETLIPAQFRQRHLGYVSGFMAHPETRAMGAGRDLFGLRKDGAEVPVEIGLNPMRTVDGVFVLASIIDITERKRLEKRISHMEALAAVGGMVAAVSHEIRNPLGSIVMAAKALARGGLDSKDLEQVMSVLVNESQRLNRTLEDFLQFARPRDPKMRVGDLNATAREVLAAVKSDKSLVGKTVVKESLDKSLPAFPFDADQVRQVLWNIFRNAFQALNGGGKFEIRTEARMGEAVIQVKDTGPGISHDQLEKIFTPFHTTKAQGTGLGLPISRNIILAHGGDIQVESAPGRGSNFSIILPLSRSSQ